MLTHAWTGARFGTWLAFGVVVAISTSRAFADSVEPASGGIGTSDRQTGRAAYARARAEQDPSASGLSIISPFLSDFADPFILRDGDVYYAFATGAKGHNLQIARSRDLLSWTMLPDALPNLPAWAAQVSGMTWAPAVFRRAERYILYYTTAEGQSGYQCISRATAMNAEGPYVDDSDRPIICQTSGATPFCGSIDPSPFVDRDGLPWLLFKSDENNPRCQTKPRIWSQRLSDDGLAVLGVASVLLDTDQIWEGPIIEGPSMIEDGDDTILFYSANWYDSPDYAIGYARCAGPAGPCTKMTLDEPLLKSNGIFLGPGGQEAFRDREGQIWLAYHAWTAPKASYATGGVRSLRLNRLDLVNGRPTINGVVNGWSEHDPKYALPFLDGAHPKSSDFLD